LVPRGKWRVIYKPRKGGKKTDPTNKRTIKTVLGGQKKNSVKSWSKKRKKKNQLICRTFTQDYEWNSPVVNCKKEKSKEKIAPLNSKKLTKRKKRTLSSASTKEEVRSASRKRNKWFKKTKRGGERGRVNPSIEKEKRALSSVKEEKTMPGLHKFAGLHAFSQKVESHFLKL